MADIPLIKNHCEICGLSREVFAEDEKGGFCPRCEETTRTHVLVVEIRDEFKGAPVRTGRIFAIVREKYELVFPDERGTLWRLMGQTEVNRIVPKEVNTP